MDSQAVSVFRIFKADGIVVVLGGLTVDCDQRNVGQVNALGVLEYMALGLTQFFCSPKHGVGKGCGNLHGQKINVFINIPDAGVYKNFKQLFRCT